MRVVCSLAHPPLPQVQVTASRWVLVALAMPPVQGLRVKTQPLLASPHSVVVQACGEVTEITAALRVDRAAVQAPMPTASAPQCLD